MKLRNNNTLGMSAKTIALFLGASALSLTSCRDNDFDWAAHHRENIESGFRQIFESVFGDISPDQSWDFTGFPTAEDMSGTRANTGNTGFYDNDDPTDYYNVPSKTIEWFQEKLPENCIINQDTKEKKYNGGEGIPATFTVPAEGFKVTPIYTGQSLIWDLYVQEVDNEGKPKDGTSPVFVWSKGTDMMVEDAACHDCDDNHKINCEVCNGTGVTSSMNVQNAVRIKAYYPILDNGNWKDGYISGNNRVENTTDAWGIVYMKKQKVNVLINLQTKKILQLNGDNLTVSEYYEGSANNVTFTKETYNGSNYVLIKIGGKYIYKDNDSANSLGVSDQRGAMGQENDLWTLEDYSSKNTQYDAVINGDNRSKYIEYSCTACSGTGKITCTTCEGDGKIDGWSVTNEYTETMSATGIKAKTINLDGKFTPGTSVKFFLKITKNRVYSEAAWTTGGKDTELWSGRQSENDSTQMIALKMPTDAMPSDKNTTTTIDGHSVQNNVFIVGCEDANVTQEFINAEIARTSSWANDAVGKVWQGKDWFENDAYFVNRVKCEDIGTYGNAYSKDQNGNPAIKETYQAILHESDWDYNDLVLLVEGYDLKATNHKPMPLQKRYMVEDLGYDPNKSVNATDIDFNDIVVDFIDNRKIYMFNYDEDGKVIGTPTLSATHDDANVEVTVRALGGTLDFTLYVVDKSKNPEEKIQIFKKSNCSDGLNTQYLYDIEKYLSRIDVKTMYNTSKNWDGTDGNYDEKQYLWSKEFSNLPQDFLINNNIVFEVETGKSSSSVEDNIYTVTFPQKGEMPKMLAFPLTIKWNEERQGIDNRWPGGGTYKPNNSDSGN